MKGHPHPQLDKGVHDEHCEESLGCDVEFTTSNYQITTTPKKEYGILSDPQMCTEEDKMDKDRETVIRSVKNVDQLVLSPIAKAAGLQPFEVKAVVSVIVVTGCHFDHALRCVVAGPVYRTHVPGLQYHAAPADGRKISS